MFLGRSRAPEKALGPRDVIPTLLFRMIISTVFGNRPKATGKRSESIPAEVQSARVSSANMVQ